MKKIRKPLLLILLAAAVCLGCVYGYLAIKEHLHQGYIYPELRVEIGSPLPSAQDYVKPGQTDPASYLTDTSGIDMNYQGQYDLQVLYKGKTHQVTLLVEDTTPPAATTRDLTVLQAQMPEAEDFITSITDASLVTVSYREQPDPADSQPQTVWLLLTDQAGNVAEFSAQLTVIIDDTPPVISGAVDIVIVEGDTPRYRTGVTVTDNVDQTVPLQIDASGVDASTRGRYSATYSATDLSGNTATVTITVTVTVKKADHQIPDVGPDVNTTQVVTEEEVVAMVNEILEEIITPEMTDREKVVAIHNYVRNTLMYSNEGMGSNFTQAAYIAIVTHRGDCRNYFALTRMLLDQAGIPNIDVVKEPNYPGDGYHYWHLVSIDGGENYYHVDTTPRAVWGVFLLWTDAMMDEYSENNWGCFNRDKSLYPPTPEKRPE